MYTVAIGTVEPFFYLFLFFILKAIFYFQIKQPIFGANYLQADLTAEPGGMMKSIILLETYGLL